MPINDRHLIDPPEPDEIPAGNCEECGETLLAYFEIYKDTRSDTHYCNRDCYRKALLAVIDDEIDYLIGLLESEGDTDAEYVLEPEVD